jgi:hypothetical protein
VVAVAAAAALLADGGLANAADISLPPANAKADYQLGGAYPPPSGVQVVSRDRTASPAAGLYNICYVNGYQTQPNETDWWKANHDNLLLKDGDGAYVEDKEWGENLFDIRTSDNRDALAAIVGGWIDGCATKGFKAVEIDNFDSFSRSGGLVSQDDALAYAQLLIDAAHARGLAIAQKNAAELASVGKDHGFDFAVAEQCGRWDECGAYVDAYGANVIVIEYRRQDFDKACQQFGWQLSIILRDVPLVPAGSGGYVYDAC